MSVWRQTKTIAGLKGGWWMVVGGTGNRRMGRQACFWKSGKYQAVINHGKAFVKKEEEEEGSGTVGGWQWEATASRGGQAMDHSDTKAFDRALYCGRSG